MTAAWARAVRTSDDGRPVAATRILTAIAALVLLHSSSRRFDATFDADRLHVPWPLVGDHLIGLPVAVPLVLWGLGAVVLLVGTCARAGAAATAAGMLCFYGADQQNYGTAGYLLILVTILLVLADPGAARTPWGPDVRRAAWWPCFLLAAQASIVYGCASIQKLRASSLRGDTIRWQLHGPLAEHVTWSHLPEALNLAGGACEAFCAIGLWFAATRRLAVVVGVGLHVGVVLFLRDSSDLVAFGIASVALYPAFWSAAPPLGDAWDRARAARATGTPTRPDLA